MREHVPLQIAVGGLAYVAFVGDGFKHGHADDRF